MSSVAADIPSQAELAAAVAAGTPCYRGLPVVVERQHGRANLDLAAVVRGDADPWVCSSRLAPGVVALRAAADSGIYVAGMTVSADDAPHVLAACRAAPAALDRHDDLADGMRLEAGRYAMRIRDQMVRARTLDAVDGWCAVLGRRVDGSLVDPNGALHEPAADIGVRCRLLVVVCPSTGRTYAIRVPATMATAREARAWVMRGAAPEVET